MANPITEHYDKQGNYLGSSSFIEMPESVKKSMEHSDKIQGDKSQEKTWELKGGIEVCSLWNYSAFIKRLVFFNDAEILKLDVFKSSWLRETILYHFKGDKNAMDNIHSEINKTLTN